MYFVPNVCFYLQDIASILNACSKGRSVLKFYKKHKLLSSSIRSALIKVVGDTLLTVQPYPKASDYEILEKKVLELFPSESKV